MIEIAFAYLRSLYMLVSGLWFWLLFGFFAAALIREFVPSGKIVRYFGRNTRSSIFLATFSGLLLSVCSCGAIPIAATLRQRGASTAASMTFLLATPWAGFIHFFVLSNFVGLGNTVLMFAFSMAAALSSGFIFSLFEKRGWIEPPVSAKHADGEKRACAACADEKHDGGIMERLAKHVPGHFASITMDIGRYMVIGFLLAAAVATFVDPQIVAAYLGSSGILLAVPLSAAIETCSEGFTILAGQLYAMGASLGVVFTMTMVGVTTDFTELSMLWGKFGRRSTLAYLAVSTAIVIILAYIINWLV